MYKKYIISLTVYVALLFCFIKIFSFDVLSAERITNHAQKVSSGQRVVDYQILEKKYCCELSEEDYSSLLKIVQAEAGCEDMEGKMLVAGVVMNRVSNSKFPDTVTEVVLQKENQVYQFSPVGNGTFYSAVPSEETIEAVDRVLQGEDITQGALYFAARKYASPDKMQWFDHHLTRLFQHGGHEFFY